MQGECISVLSGSVIRMLTPSVLSPRLPGVLSMDALMVQTSLIIRTKALHSLSSVSWTVAVHHRLNASILTAFVLGVSIAVFGT